MADNIKNVDRDSTTDSDYSSLKLPYGIAKGLGLSTDGMTPSQVWAMLSGYGMKPKEIYKKFYEEKADLHPIEISEAIEVVEDYKVDDEKDPFNSKAYSEDRIKNALNSSDPAVFDKMARKPTYMVWKKLSQQQQEAVIDYTGGYSKYNEPLRGIEYGSNKYLGVGNIDLEMIGVHGYGSYKKGEVKAKIDSLTSAIENSTYPEDVILRRGTNFTGMDKFFQGVTESELRYASEEKLKMLLEGKTFTEPAFSSCGSTKGKGFSGKSIQFSIYAPKGTKMMYVEPVSKFGEGTHGANNWTGQEQKTFGYEDETVIQRGTSFKVTKVERLPGGNLYIQMAVVGQEKFN